MAISSVQSLALRHCICSARTPGRWHWLSAFFLLFPVIIGAIILVLIGWLYNNALDDPTGIKAAAQIYVESKADYYTIDDGLPQHIGGQHDVRLPDWAFAGLAARMPSATGLASII